MKDEPEGSADEAGQSRTDASLSNLPPIPSVEVLATQLGVVVTTGLNATRILARKDDIADLLGLSCVDPSHDTGPGLQAS